MYVDILSSSSFIFYLLYCYATIYNNYTQFPHPWCTQSVEGIKDVSCLSTCADNTRCCASEAEKDGLSFFPSCFLSPLWPIDPRGYCPTSRTNGLEPASTSMWWMCDCVCVCVRVCLCVCACVALVSGLLAGRVGLHHTKATSSVSFYSNRRVNVAHQSSCTVQRPPRPLAHTHTGQVTDDLQAGKDFFYYYSYM